MRRVLTWALAAVLPALLVSALGVGCGGNDKKEDSGKPAPKKTHKTGGSEALKPVDSKETCTLKGRVTLAGDKPEGALKAKDKEVMELIDGLKDAQDKKVCLSGDTNEKTQQEWRFGENNGVADVFVWAAPPEGHYFKVDLSKKTWPEKVFIDQPHCAFEPHAVVLFPGAYDPDNPEDAKPTGQKFIVKNSAPISHNTDWKGGEKNPGNNKIIPSKGELEIPDLKPSDDPINLKCDIHKFMNGVARAYNHPYATKTDKDGNYEIKNVPAGAEVRLIVWHQAAGYGSTGKDGEKATLKSGEDSKNFTVKAP